MGGGQAMPYRFAHWVVVLVLVPIIALAFWPAYFEDLPNAPFAFHAHGLTATAWILLVAAQSWTIHGRQRALHRALGLAVFVLVPLFAGGAALVLNSMAVKFAQGSHPFYAVFGARLGLHDVVSTTALVAMVGAALRYRRRVALHSGYMLATPLLVLPPIVARLGLPVPPQVHPGELIAILAAASLYVAARPNGRPFLIVIAVMLLEIGLFETWGASAAWGRAFVQLSHWSAAGLAIGAMAAAALVLWAGWSRAAPRRT
jgi:hypothetical protein